MQHQDLLLTIAEVSAAFAGFSGVVGVFRERAQKLEAQLQLHRLTQMIATSLSALAMSVTPFLIAAFGVPEPVVWRISSMLYALFATILTARGMTRGHAFTQVGLTSVRTTQVIVWLTIVIVGISILNGLGVFSSRTSAFYLVALFWTLGLSGFFFTRLIASSQVP